MSNLLFESVLILSFVCCLLAQGQRVAEKKCSGFRDLTIISPSFFPGDPIPIQRFNCSRTVDLIPNGEKVKPGEFPHQALLGYANPDAPEGYNFYCGGSLISERFVLTAAHCFVQYPSIVRLGEHSLQDENDNQIDLGIEKIFKHPQHRFRTAYNDIALIKLNQDVQFSKFIRPACLWTGDNFNVSSVIASGFGLYDRTGLDSADVLQKVILDFLDREQCDKAFHGRRFPQGVLDSQLCIGSEHGGKDTFVVDSGAPIQVITEPKGCTYHVLGVTSRVMRGQQTAIYTKVSSYLDWIEQTVWPNEE